MGATIRTLGLFAFMIGLFMAIGWLVGSLFLGDWLLGAIVFLVLAALVNAISYFFSSKIVLWSYRVRLVSEAEAPRLYRTVRNIAAMNGMPMPKVGIIPTSTPNAFATGRGPKNAVVCATEGLMRILDDEELSGVMAHEMAHVKNRDILISTIAATFAGAVFILARMAQFAAIFGGGRGGRDSRGGVFSLLIVAIVAPLAAMIVRMAISRSREYQADASGAHISGDPLSLAGALRKLESGIQRSRAEVNPSTAHLFIVNPLKGGSILALFSTHPPMEERIRRLEHMARGPVS